jgi:hypothetical protein
MMQPTTKPSKEDQDAPLVPGRTALADIALAFGVCADDVHAYLASHSAFLSAPHRLLAACIELQSAAF